KKISALIVKNPNEGDTIPEVIEEVCAKRNIAMIVIHRDVPFISIIRKVTRKLFSQDVERLEYFREINHRFTELSIRNMDDEVIIQTLESLTGNPVTIYNALFRSEVCAKRNIAMIVIHRDVPFISIIRKVTRKLFSQDVERLEYFREINHRFTELSIRNMDDEVIIQTLESLTGNPVTIYNELF